MASFNKVIVMGNLTRDPEVKYTAGGTAVAKIGLAVNEQFKDTSGYIQKKVVFLTIVVWGKQAETCGKFLAKGRCLHVEGRLSTRSWEHEGRKHFATEIVAERTTFVGGSPKTEGQTTSPEAGDDLPNQQPMDEADYGNVPF